ncbi:MAG: peptide chain release factor aRF-1 [archaeon]
MGLELFEFKKHLKELSGKRARHTELISVYIPPETELAKVINQIKDEQGTASNIKSTTTRKNVQTALERMVQHLRLFKKVPEHGLAVFSGNTSEKEGRDNFEIFSIIPPQPIHIRTYLCEQKFFLDPLFEMAEITDVYGLIVIELGGAVVGLLKGTHIEVVQEVKSIVPGKFRAGGQSSVRFAHVRENLANDFYKKVGEIASSIFMTTKNLKGIILGGAGPTKETFESGDFLRREMKQLIIGVKDVGYTGLEGLRELVARSEDILSSAEITKERILMNEFLRRLSTGGFVAYGEGEVRKAIEMNAVDILLISDRTERIRVLVKCQNSAACQYSRSETIDTNVDSYYFKLRNEQCPSCGGSLAISESRDVIEDLVETMERLGGKVELISSETSEGEQLFNLGGLAALLRFRI